MVRRSRGIPQIGESGREKPGFLGIVSQQKGTTPHSFDQLPRDLRPYRWTPPASPDASFAHPHIQANVVCRVNDDSALHGPIVNSFFQTSQPERQAVLPDVGVARLEHSEAGHQTPWLVRKPDRAVIAGILAVRDQFLKQYAGVDQIEDP